MATFADTLLGLPNQPITVTDNVVNALYNPGERYAQWVAELYYLSQAMVYTTLTPKGKRAFRKNIYSLARTYARRLRVSLGPVAAVMPDINNNNEWKQRFDYLESQTVSVIMEAARFRGGWKSEANKLARRFNNWYKSFGSKINWAEGSNSTSSQPNSVFADSLTGTLQTPAQPNGIAFGSTDL